jgi:hypothetical protein
VLPRHQTSRSLVRPFSRSLVRPFSRSLVRPFSRSLFLSFDHRCCTPDSLPSVPRTHTFLFFALLRAPRAPLRAYTHAHEPQLICGKENTCFLLLQAYLQLLLARVTTNSLDDPNLLREALKDRGVNAVPASEPSEPDPFTSADPRSLSARRGPNEERTVLQRPGPGPGPGEAAASSDEGSTSRSSSRSTYHHARGSAGPGLLVLQRCTDKIQIRQRHTSPFASRLCPRPILCHSLFAAAD